MINTYFGLESFPLSTHYLESSATMPAMQTYAVTTVHMPTWFIVYLATRTPARRTAR